MPRQRSVHSLVRLATGALTVTALVAFGPGAVAQASVSTATEVLGSDVLPGLTGLASTPTDTSTPVEVGITLASPNAAAQHALYEAMYTPGSPEYHQFLSADQVAAQFGIPQATFASLVTWATRDGLQVSYAAATHDYVLLSGTAGQAEQTFSVSLANFTRNGSSFYANTTGPTVPAGLGVSGVIGLNNLLKSHTFSHAPSSSAVHGSAVVPQQGTCVTFCTGLTTPQDLWSVYGQPSNLADPTQDFGQGQQMAVLGEGAVSGPLNDLRGHEAEFNLPQVPITIHSVGDTFTDTSGSPEWDIDSQASLGMAPKVSGETWYFANDLSDASVLADFEAWSTDPNGPMQANASFGECEQDPTSPATGGGVSTPTGGLAGTAGIMFTQGSENTLEQANLQGKTLFSSTGDTGSSCPVVYAAVIGAGNGVLNQGNPETNYPASSIHVVAVGGTVLYTNPNTATPAPASNATRFDEYNWNFTGGGTTAYIAEPTYQKGIAPVDNVACISQPDGTPYATLPQPCRGIPDVAAQSGDVPTNGYATTMGGANDGAGGGTSLSSPLWMGMWTRIQAAATTTNGAGQHTNGFANPALYAIGKDTTKDPVDFFDIGGGAPSSTPNNNGYYTSLPRTALNPSGWDYVSGLGTPNVTALGKDITKNASFAPTQVVTVPTPQDCGQPGLAACTVGGGGNSCTNPLALWTNPAHTANDPLFGNPDPQQSLLQGGLALTTNGTTLRALLTVTNLQLTVPTGYGAAEWYALWTYGGTTYFANAELAAASTTPTYHDGTVSTVGNSHQYNSSTNTNDTGSFTLGPNGVVEIDVPLANVGHPPISAELVNPAGETWLLVGASAAGGSLQRVDAGGPQCSYQLGAAPTNVPEVPVAPFIPLAGLAAAAWVVRRRRALPVSA